LTAVPAVGGLAAAYKGVQVAVGSIVGSLFHVEQAEAHRDVLLKKCRPNGRISEIRLEGPIEGNYNQPSFKQSVGQSKGAFG
jgi:hypothetical protein